MSNWPTWTDDSKVAHQQIVKSHVPLFLPIADESGSIIPPRDWHLALGGSVAIVKFSIHHWNIAGRKSFPAEVDSMMVIEKREVAQPAIGRKEVVTHLNLLEGDSDSDGARDEGGSANKFPNEKEAGEKGGVMESGVGKKRGAGSDGEEDLEPLTDDERLDELHEKGAKGPRSKKMRK